MFVWKPSQTCGTARRKPSGLKNEWRNLPISAPPQRANRLFQDRRDRVEKPLLHQTLDGPICLERVDRLVQGGLQFAPLVHDRPVMLLRDDLAGDAAICARL